MVLDHTLLDDPKTPAYKFAYRAFRGMLYGAPDTSPTMPTYHDHSHDGKENDAPRDFGLIDSSSAKRKSPSRRDNDTTPKRQRTIAVSPSKSILRNPNLPTPRRAQTRELNVTFKDLSKSVSPEILRDLQPSHVVRSISPVDAASSLAPRSPKRPLPDSTGSTRTSSAGEPIRNNKEQFDLQKYVAQTEKEIKKLIKYGQKMRDIAKEQKAENKKMKQMLDDVRNENKELQRLLVQAGKVHNLKDCIDGMSFEVRRMNAEDNKRRTVRDKKADYGLAPCKQDAKLMAPSTKMTGRLTKRTDRQSDPVLDRLAALSIERPTKRNPSPPRPPKSIEGAKPIRTRAQHSPSHTQAEDVEDEISRVLAEPGSGPAASIQNTADDKEERRRQARERLALRRARIASAPVKSVQDTFEPPTPRSSRTAQANIDSSNFDPWLAH